MHCLYWPVVCIAAPLVTLERQQSLKGHVMGIPIRSQQVTYLSTWITWIKCLFHFNDRKSAATPFTLFRNVQVHTADALRYSLDAVWWPVLFKLLHSLFCSAVFGLQMQLAMGGWNELQATESSGATQLDPPSGPPPPLPPWRFTILFPAEPPSFCHTSDPLESAILIGRF